MSVQGLVGNIAVSNNKIFCLFLSNNSMKISSCIIIYAIYLTPIGTSTLLGLFCVAKGTCFWIQSDFDSEIPTDCAHKALLSLNAHPLIATLSLANQTGQAWMPQKNCYNYKGIQSQKHQSRNTKRLVMYKASVTVKPTTVNWMEKKKKNIFISKNFVKYQKFLRENLLLHSVA